jgi:hypothetical protein
LNIWCRYTRFQIITKELETEKALNQNRMKNFLENAITNKNDDDSSTLSSPPSTTRTTDRYSAKVSQRPSTRQTTSRSTYKTLSSPPPLPPPPTTKSKKEINRIDDNPGSQTEVPLTDAVLTRKVKEIMWPWVKTPFQNSPHHDNRFKAQNKILNEQRKMIKEQQKMIDDMKFKQNQAEFKEQIAMLEKMKAEQVNLKVFLNLFKPIFVFIVWLIRLN